MFESLQYSCKLHHGLCFSVWLAAVLDPEAKPENAQLFWKEFDGYEARRVRPVTCWGLKPWGRPNPEAPVDENEHTLGKKAGTVKIRVLLPPGIIHK